MNDRDQRRYDRLQRVQTFGRERAADFAEGSKARTHFTAIGQLLEQLEAARAGQAPARVSKGTLLDALLLDLKNIARTARAIEAGQPAEPGFAAPFRLPDNPAESALLAHADAVLTVLEDDDALDSAAEKTAKVARRARFAAYELPEDFAVELRASRDAIGEANQHNQAKTQGGVENTALIGVLLQQAGAEVEQLEAIMNNKYTRQPEKLRAWVSASRVERAPRREKPAAPAPAAPAPAATASVTA